MARKDEHLFFEVPVTPEDQDVDTRQGAERDVLASAAAALACLLSLVALAARFRWVRALGFFSDAALTTMLTLFIWDLLDTESDSFARITGCDSSRCCDH